MSGFCGAACGGPAPAVPPAPSATPSPTADPGLEARAQLREIVTQTAVAPSSVGGTKYKSEDPKTAPPTVPCNGTVTANSLVASHTWTFDDAKITLAATYAYHPDLGTAVVEGIRAELVKCTSTWTFGQAFDMKAAGQFTVTTPTGFDNALAFCHEGTLLNGENKGKKAFICEVFLSRGHLVSHATDLALEKKAAQDEIKKAVPALAAAIVKAQPAV